MFASPERHQEALDSNERQRAAAGLCRGILRSRRGGVVIGRASLFDSERFRRHIEAAYTIMWERRRRGDAPANLSVVPDGGASVA